MSLKLLRFKLKKHEYACRKSHYKNQTVITHHTTNKQKIDRNHFLKTSED